MGKRVLLGMSGGVDSSVAAILLKKKGYEVVGITMKLWTEKNDSSNCISSAIDDAKKVCDLLQIEHHIVDFEDEFRKKVVNDFICCYKNACTPNPCIECNKHIKFGLLYKKALELECDFIATGHYAKVEFDKVIGQLVLKKSKSENKDQTYFLYGITKEVLPKILFPLADYNDKNEIRQIAKEHNLQVAEKPDSQEICFIKDNDYVRFLMENSVNNQKKGNIILENGTIVGKHEGLISYTVGQRKGLGITYPVPLYVLRIDKEQNAVIVGEEEKLYSKKLVAKDLNFLVDVKDGKEVEVLAKIRYKAKPAKATICKENKEVVVNFEEPQRAITPGQSVVFYMDDIVIGGGKIK